MVLSDVSYGRHHPEQEQNDFQEVSSMNWYHLKKAQA